MKNLILIKSCGVLFVVALFVYFVSDFTKVYDPIKSYQFNVNLSKLKSGLVGSCESFDGCEIKFSDLVKGERNSAQIRIRGADRLFVYSVVLNKKNNSSSIELISATGYRIQSGVLRNNNTDIVKLLKNFEDTFIKTYPLVNYLK